MLPVSARRLELNRQEVSRLASAVPVARVWLRAQKCAFQARRERIE
jgi:hypothetical protein